MIEFKNTSAILYQDPESEYSKRIVDYASMGTSWNQTIGGNWYFNFDAMSRETYQLTPMSFLTGVVRVGGYLSVFMVTVSILQILNRYLFTRQLRSITPSGSKIEHHFSYEKFN